ncbi:MAG: exodeoxyribonuclease VII large subunit, partial [Edaphobacter sp.]
MAEKDANPPTLASLRAGRGKTRSQSRLPVQGGLFFAPETPALPTPPVPASRRIWTVRDLVVDIRQQVEGGYPDLWVEGEISNYRAAPSGHIYFTLKDGEAQLPVVLFRRQATL